MTLLQLVVFAASVTTVVTEGSIFKPIRDRGPKLWQELVGCPLCLGVWIGAGYLGIKHFGPWWLREAAIALGAACVVGVVAMSVKMLWDVLDSLDRKPPERLN